MKNTLIIPVLNGCTSLNGLITLFIHHWSGNISKLKLVEPANISDKELYIFPIQTTTSALVDQQFTCLTTLPVLVVGACENLHELSVSGLAAVCRHVIKSSDDPKVKQSLGFRGNCLQAPAEVSVWTAFCEVQMPQSTFDYLSQSQEDLEIVEVPAALVQFEEHLKQPIRMHNVVKRWQQEVGLEAAGQQTNGQKLAGALLDHAFAEGTDMTLADLLLYPCAILLAGRLSNLGIRLADHLPRVARWISTMTSAVRSAWLATLSDESLGLERLTIRSSPVVKLPRVIEASLYKKDSKRPSVGNLTTEEITHVLDLVKTQKLWPSSEDKERLSEGNHVSYLSLPEGLVDYVNVDACDEFEPRIDWSSLPEPAHPRQGHVPGSRLDRKIQQLDGMVAAVIDSASEGDVIVDFCAGGGHLGILLAHLLPRCRVVMIDNKEESVHHARRRAAQLGLANVILVQGNIDYFRGRLDLGVALHACGVATDLVLRTCVEKRAAFVLCPCCYGNLAHPNLPVDYPQSGLFRERLISPENFAALARLADHVTQNGRIAMASVDLDRLASAAQNGYKVVLKKLKPDSCSPKHDLLVGVPR